LAADVQESRQTKNEMKEPVTISLSSKFGGFYYFSNPLNWSSEQLSNCSASNRLDQGEYVCKRTRNSIDILCSLQVGLRCSL
jgi:hypothetical protein